MAEGVGEVTDRDTQGTSNNMIKAECFLNKQTSSQQPQRQAYLGGGGESFAALCTSPPCQCCHRKRTNYGTGMPVAEAEWDCWGMRK